MAMIGRITRLLIKVVVVVLVLVLAVSSFESRLLKFGTLRMVREVTGLEASVQFVDVGIFKSAVDVQGLRIFNPPEYPDKVMADISEIYAYYDLNALFRGSLDFRELRIHVSEFTVIKTAQGKLNFTELRALKSPLKKTAPDTLQGAAGLFPDMKIDTFYLRIDKVRLKDYSQGAAPTIQEFPLQLDERFENITDVRSLISLMVVKAVRKSAINQMLDLNLDPLIKNTAGLLKKTGSVVMKGVDTAADAAKKMGELAGGPAKKAPVE